MSSLVVAVTTGYAPFQPLHPLRYWGYQWWSGFGSDLGYIVQLVAGLVIAWRIYKGLKHHFECHEESCSRVGVHPVHGTPYRTCWHHHPILSQHGHKKVPLHVIHREHHAAREGAIRTTDGR